MVNERLEWNNDNEQIKWGEIKTNQIWRKFDPNGHNEFNVSNRGLVQFLTGSTYKGKWSPVNMDSVGTFTLPHGVVYRGQMKDGLFHGRGILMYPSGQIILGEWHNGEITTWNSEHRKIEQCNKSQYCKPPDRRFLTSLKGELMPPGSENLTNDQPTKKIPECCYDVGDGFFNPNTLWVHSYTNFSKLLYMPSSDNISADLNILEDKGANFVRKIPCAPIYKSSKWIENCCRKSWDQPTGYRPEYYEYWCSGRKAERKQLNMRVASRESVCDQLLNYFESIADSSRKIRRETINLGYSKSNI